MGFIPNATYSIHWTDRWLGAMDTNNKQCCPVMDEDSTERQLKVVLLGEPSSGKTSIVSRFCHNEYNRQYYPTFGTDFLLHRHQLRVGKEVTLVIWDLSGQVLSSPMLSYCLYGANVILAVYDITNAASFSKLTEWIAAVKKTPTDSLPNLAIIANKCDMEHQRAVSVEKQVKFANDHGIPTHTVSARTGENVVTALQKVCAEVLGLKLTRLEQEAGQAVVKAEILAPMQGHAPTYQSTSSSSICSVQ